MEDSEHFISEGKQNVVSIKKISKKEQERQYIEWRRSKILELKAQGYTTERELADKLKVSDSTIHKDFVFLREQARENFKTHIQDRLPSEYERCITGMNQVLKLSWDIANQSTDNNDNDQTITGVTVDNKTRLQALALVNDCYKYIMDLTTNGVVITDAIKFVQTSKEKLTTAMSAKEENSKESNQSDYNEDKDQLEEKQEEGSGEIATTNTTF